MKSAITRLWHYGIAVGLLVCLSQSVAAQAPAFTQATVCGTAVGSGSFALATALTADAQGNAFLTGYFNGTVRFGSITLVGSYSAFVAKRDAAGTWLWAVSGVGATCSAIALDAQGQVYVTGLLGGGALNVPTTYTFGTITLTTAGGTDVLVAKLDAATGTWLWAQRAGFGTAAAGANRAMAIALDGLGGAYVAGTFDGPIIRIGSTTLYNAGNSTSTLRKDIFLAHLDATTGAWEWAQGAGDAQNDDTVTGLTTDGQGNAYLTGIFGFGIAFPPFQLSNATGACYLAKVNARGTWQWAQNVVGTQGAGTFAGTGGTYCNGLAADGQGHLYVCGGFSGATAPFGSTTLTNASATYQGPGAPGSVQMSDAFVARLNANTGAWQWATRAGGPDAESLTQVMVRGSRVYTSGVFGRTPAQGPPSPGGSAFGATAVVSTGKTDLVVAGLDTAGTWQWAVRAGSLEEDVVTGLVADAGNRLHVLGTFAGATAQFGSLSVAANATGYTVFLAQLAGGPLSSALSRATSPFSLYPNPGLTHQKWQSAFAASGAVLQPLVVIAFSTQMCPHGPEWNCRIFDA